MKMTGKHDGPVLAERIRKALAGRRSITEKRMMGGVCFLLGDHMLCGTAKRGFLFRVGETQHADALARRGATPMILGGRKSKGFVWVAPKACDARALRGWLLLAERYVGALPPKRKSR